MNSKIVVAILLVCSGCMMWDAGYTDNVDVIRHDVDIYDKVPITYSVNVTSSDKDNEGGYAKTFKVREVIEKALKDTGLFSDVCYGTKDGDDSYHVSFFVRFNVTPVNRMIGHVYLSELSLLLIPNGDVEPVDLSAIVYLKGVPIYSTAKAEELRYLIWLPTVPVSLFMNTWTVGRAIIEGSVNSAVNDIAREHKARFINSSR